MQSKYWNTDLITVKTVCDIHILTSKQADYFNNSKAIGDALESGVKGLARLKRAKHALRYALQVVRHWSELPMVCLEE